MKVFVVFVSLLLTNASGLTVISRVLFRDILEPFLSLGDIYLSFHKSVMHFHASISLWDRLTIETMVARDLHPALEPLSDNPVTRVISAGGNVTTTWVYEGGARRSYGSSFN